MILAREITAALLAALLAAGCSTWRSDCRSPDDTWPHDHEFTIDVDSGEKPPLDSSSAFCVAAYDDDSGADLTQAFNKKLNDARIVATPAAECQGREGASRIELHVVATTCVDCGRCRRGPRGVMAHVVIVESGRRHRALWWTHQGGTTEHLLDAFVATFVAEAMRGNADVEYRGLVSNAP